MTTDESVTKALNAGHEKSSHWSQNDESSSGPPSNAKSSLRSELASELEQGTLKACVLLK